MTTKQTLGSLYAPDGSLYVTLADGSGNLGTGSGIVSTIGAELPTDSTGTFTNATQTNSLTANGLDGYGTALISITGTYGTASAVFEISDDAGTTWFPVLGSQTGASVAELGYTSLTNISRTWIVPISGADSFRVRSTAVASGTVSVRVSISSAVPPNSAVSSIATSAPTGGYSFLNIAAGQATTTVKSGSGTLHAIVFNSAAAATNVTTVFDNTAASGTVIAIPAATAVTFPVSVLFDIAFSTGLTILTATANGSNMTVIYK